MQRQGGPAQHPPPLACQFPPKVAHCLAKQNGWTLPRVQHHQKWGSWGLSSSTGCFPHMCFQVMLCIFMQSASFGPAVPRGCGPRAEPQPLEGIWRTPDQWAAGGWPACQPALPVWPTVPSYSVQQVVLSQCLPHSVFLQLPLGAVVWSRHGIGCSHGTSGSAAANGQQLRWSNAPE